MRRLTSRSWPCRASRSWASVGRARSRDSWRGLLRGVLAGANLAAYAISRTLLGFALGWVRFAGLVPNALVAALAAFAGTLVAGLMVMLVSHRGPVLPFLAGTLFAAMIDAALAMPLYACLGRLIDPANDR